MTAAVRFWSKVSQTGNVCECWDWTAAKSIGGYGVIRVDGKNKMAHRASWEMSNGPVPAGLELDHLCRNRACVNPWHLEPVTRHENTMRGDLPGIVKARCAAITHCPRGHEYTPDNVYINRSQGIEKRVCRECVRVANRAWKAKRKAAS